MECFSLIYWLLIASLVALSLIGIWDDWGKGYLLPIVLAIFLLLADKRIKLLCLKIRSLCIWIRQRIRSCRQAQVIRLANYLNRIVLGWRSRQMASYLLLLAPKVDKNAHAEYVHRLRAAIDNPNVHNIALSGAYGAGKSSILKTFKACYPSQKYVDVSLASFGENSQDGKEDKEENKLEYRILQQLFYHVKTSDISESRFGRIERVNLTSKIGWTFAVCLLAVSYVCLFKTACFGGIFPKIKIILERENSKFIALLVFVVAFIFIVFKLVHLLKRLGIKNLGVNISSASLEIEDRKSVTAMNRYLDEIIYLFQKKKYEVVFFEDLDRFENIRIFTKLRELNQILNQSEEIKQRVVFVYALCDDVFATPEARTKFFDYIIPVIPYVNVSNSGDLFTRSFKTLQIPKDKLSTQFLTDISHFVNDTRVLKNIINEFTLYQKVLDPKLNLEHLLAIILYKNLYPKDFCLLHQGKGLVYDAFASVPLLKKEKRDSIQQRLRDISDEVKKINDEIFEDIGELNALVVANFLKQCPQEYERIIDFNGNEIPVDLLFNDHNASLILQGKMEFSYFHGRRRPISKEQMRQALGEKFDYDKRKGLIEKKNNGELNKLYNERNRLDNKLTYLDNFQLQSLVDSVQKVFAYVKPYQKLSDAEKSKYDILGYLLKEGYIDEDYFYYISIFQEGRLTPQDHEFLMSVKFDKPKGYGFRLNEIETIVSNLKDTDYSKPAIVNFSLLQFLLEKEDLYANQCYMFFGALIQAEGLDALYYYIYQYGSVPAFVRRLVNFHVGFIDELFADETHSLQDKLHFLSLVFAYADIDDIRKLNNDHPVGKYLDDIDNYWDAFVLCDENKALRILDTIKLNFKTLKMGAIPHSEVLIEYVCESGMFQLNLDNIRFVAHRYHLNLEASSSSICTTILDSNLDFLKKHIKDDINEFAEIVVKENVSNLVSEEEVIGLLKEDNVEFETKVDLVYHKKFLVKIGPEIDPDLLPFLIEEDKLKANLDNIMDAYGENGRKFSKNLIDFMNRHVSELCEEIQGKTKVDTGDEVFLPAIIKEPELDEKFAETILVNPSLGETWKEDISILTKRQLFYVLRKKILPLDYMDSGVADLFLEYYKKDDSEFDYGLFVKALELSDDNVLKAMAYAICIKKSMLHLKEIPNTLGVMGDAFDKFKMIGKTVKVPNSDGYKELVDALHNVKYLGKVTPQGNEISIRVLKH